MCTKTVWLAKRSNKYNNVLRMYCNTAHQYGGTTQVPTTPAGWTVQRTTWCEKHVPLFCNIELRVISGTISVSDNKGFSCCCSQSKSRIDAFSACRTWQQPHENYYCSQPQDIHKLSHCKPVAFKLSRPMEHFRVNLNFSETLQSKI